MFVGDHFESRVRCLCVFFTLTCVASVLFMCVRGTVVFLGYSGDFARDINFPSLCYIHWTTFSKGLYLEILRILHVNIQHITNKSFKFRDPVFETLEKAYEFRHI